MSQAKSTQSRHSPLAHSAPTGTGPCLGLFWANKREPHSLIMLMSSLMINAKTPLYIYHASFQLFKCFLLTECFFWRVQTFLMVYLILLRLITLSHLFFYLILSHFTPLNHASYLQNVFLEGAKISYGLSHFTPLNYAITFIILIHLILFYSPWYNTERNEWICI